jgi:hypothetical protein
MFRDVCHALTAGKMGFAGVSYFVFLTQCNFALCAANARAGSRDGVVSRPNKFRKPILLTRTPWHDERNAMDRHPSPSNLATAVA